MVFVLPYYTRPLSDPYGLTVHHADIVQLALLSSVGFEIIVFNHGDGSLIDFSSQDGSITGTVL